MEKNATQNNEILQEQNMLDSYKKEIDLMGPFGLLSEIENLKKHREFCEEQLALSQQGLKELNEWEEIENKLIKAKKIYCTIGGTVAGIASDLIFVLSQKLFDITVSLSENLIALGGFAGGGTLLGYAFYKLKKENESQARRAGAQKIITEKRNLMFDVKTYYEKEMAITDKKINMARTVVREKQAQEEKIIKK